MAYSLVYLGVGNAIALWGVVAPTVRGWSAGFRSTALLVYIFIVPLFHRLSVFNDLYVVLGFVAIVVCRGDTYTCGTTWLPMALVSLALSVALSVWGVLVFTDRANENLFSWLVILGLIAWAAQIAIYARILKRSGEPRGFYDAYREPEDWLTWDLKQNDVAIKKPPRSRPSRMAPRSRGYCAHRRRSASSWRFEG